MDTGSLGASAAGLEIRELPGESVARAARHFNENRHPQLNDCFALALAEDIDDCVLLTGDGALRRVAEENGVEVRGVLWIIDQLEAKWCPFAGSTRCLKRFVTMSSFSSRRLRSSVG
ncbi:MAG: hypothetical protein M5U32_18315 [Myxococcota bacterium]|nr:hypothetical protein [Myxococcota bacterium]